MPKRLPWVRPLARDVEARNRQDPSRRRPSRWRRPVLCASILTSWARRFGFLEAGASVLQAPVAVVETGHSDPTAACDANSVGLPIDHIDPAE